MYSLKIIQILKKELKAKRLTYNDIAIHLKITEAGVKKLLSKNDISLNRFEHLCELIEKSTVEIFRMAYDSDVDSTQFTEQQVIFFIKNPHYFHFYMKLAYENKKPSFILNEYKLSSKSINLYLKKLEEFNLIKRHPYERLQVIGGIPLAINTSETELELMKYEIALEQLQLLKEQKSKNLSGAGLYLTEPEKDELIKKMLNILIEYSSVSRQNRKKENKSAKDCMIMSFVKDGSMFNKIIDLK